MRVLVCGGRDFSDREQMDKVLRFLDRHKGPISCVIHGAYKGADTLADEWAKGCGLPVEPYPADWKKHDKAAGPIRNRQMLDEGKPDYVVAFRGNQGTAGMVSMAKARGLKVFEIKWSKPARHHRQHCKHKEQPRCNERANDKMAKGGHFFSFRTANVAASPITIAGTRISAISFMAGGTARITKPVPRFGLIMLTA